VQESPRDDVLRLLMFDQGSGPPIVVVQPLQGRWQWMRRFLNALSAQCRVITYTLCSDLGSDVCPDTPQGFERYVRQLENVIDCARVERFALCGISFGGTVAVRYAARYPGRITHLVIQSSPGPGWRANPEQNRYVSNPVLTLPRFLLSAFGRLRVELKAGLPRPWDRFVFIVRAALTALHYPPMPHLMANRVRLMEALNLAEDAARVSAPTLVVTGEPGIERVVPVESTKQYLAYIPHSRYEMIPNAGHTVSLIHPECLARITSEFVNGSHS
jgi:pimeloyl-ACP methyl ester carboxylesterase